jgi:hypothetical protein
VGAYSSYVFPVIDRHVFEYQLLSWFLAAVVVGAVLLVVAAARRTTLLRRA